MRIDTCFHREEGQPSEAIHQVKETRHTITYIEQLIFFDIFRNGEPIDTNSEVVVALGRHSKEGLIIKLLGGQCMNLCTLKDLWAMRLW